MNTIAQAISAQRRRPGLPRFQPVPEQLELLPPPVPVRPKVKRHDPPPRPRRRATYVTPSMQRAQDAIEKAQTALLVEATRPVSRERWSRIADAYNARGNGLLALSKAVGAGDRAAREAMRQAALTDLERSRTLRHRLGVTR